MKCDYRAHSSLYDVASRSEDLLKAWRSNVQLFREQAQNQRYSIYKFVITEQNDHSIVDVETLTVRIRLRLSFALVKDFLTPRGRIDAYEVTNTPDEEERNIGFFNFSPNGYTSIEDGAVELSSLPDIILTAIHDILRARGQPA